MKTVKMLKNCCLVLPLVFVLTGCGAPAQAPQTEPAGVQDIQPGEKSIIQAPAANRSGSSQLEERNI